ncbi:MAG: hypothetical protein IKO85_03875 [Bacteroidaceae bacterium]|nr:hypothetical protein [Bacteroidaceae bacterium]
MINYKLYRNGPNEQNGALEAKGVQRAHGADGLNGLRGACGRHGANGLRGANGHHGLNRVYRALSFIIYPLLFIILLTCPFSVQAQIKIGGNVYGGGNHAEVKGSTKVTVKAGDIGAVLDPDAERPLKDPHGRVFGGARMANVGGNTFVHIDGENATDYILINQVYGGNDIAGAIGTAKAVKEEVPTELTAVLPEPTTEQLTESGKTRDKWREDYKKDNPNLNAVDNTFNSYVRVSTKATTDHYTKEEIAAAANNPEAAAYGKKTTDVKPATDAKKVYIGQLFAGGNGDFDYEQSAPVGGKVTHTIYNRWDDKHTTPLAQVVTDAGEVGFQLPELDKTYLEVVGGSIVYAYGGGNDATVKEQNIIHIDNPSAVVNHIWTNSTGLEVAEGTSGAIDLLSYARFKEMGINTTFSHPSSGEYQIGRFFGGNNKAAMSIRPTWNLLAGKVRNLYSGGNRGNMTSPEGLLLEIPDYSSLIVDNLYGGCRMADVIPTVGGIYKPCVNLPGYYFPNELSARTLVRGGHINNVYGGNDVTGTVYGGNAIGIYTTVYGDVYGGGNGNYPYTDNEELKNHDVFGDFYYDLNGKTSAAALNAFRPNAEQVSIRLKGKNATLEGYTVIQGSVFLGGNCASLSNPDDDPKVELKIGSYVIADNVFLGNNGEGMIKDDNLKYYSGYVDNDGNYFTSGDASGVTSFSSLNLKGDGSDASVFRTYMTGVAMPLKPSVVFDSKTEGDPDTYVPFSSFVGSFYCGGNVGSMTFKGKESLTIKEGLNIYEKFVGGCNSADVKKGTYNAAYQGGVIGTEDEQEEDGYKEGDKIKDRIEINLENLTITPLRWNDSFTQLLWNTQKWDDNAYFEIEEGTELEEGEKYYTPIYAEHTVGSSAYTVLDTDHFYSKGEGDVYKEIVAGTVLAGYATYYTKTDSYTKHEVTGSSKTVGEDDEFYEKGGFVEVARDPSDSDIRLLGGNVYGGCYESGHVNGNVVININQEMLNKDKVFGNSPDGVFGNPASGVELEDQRDDLIAVALSVFGAGYGEKTEVWGSTTVNHTNGYTFQIYGGGEQGVVGKKNDEGDYDFDPAYSATVNLSGMVSANSNDDVVPNLAEAEYIYGGGNEGDVCGNTYVNLGNGRIYDAFGGASDADILGHTEVYIGRQPNGSGGYKDGFPWIRDIVYGGNDFGGTILGAYEDKYDYEARLRDVDDMPQLHGFKDGEELDVLKSSTYVEYLEGRVDTIFGGGYGSYNYANTALYGVGSAMPVQHSSFVNIRPKDHAKNALKAVFGGGTGYPGNRDGDKAQDRSYVLIDISDDIKSFGDLEAFGGGSYNGLGMKYTFDSESGKTVDESGTAINLDEASAIVDLLHGNIKNAFGGSYQEGVTRRTVVNVPAESTIKIENIFGGAYGKYILPPCDVYETQVNYKNTSEKAQMSGAIYGGNNNERRSLFTQVNISSPVWTNKDKGYTGTVYGAGRGIDTWSEHTEVNLLDGARVYEAYGGGEMGHVLNSKSIQVYMNSYFDQPSQQISEQDPVWSQNKYWNIVNGKKESLKSDALFNPDDPSDTRTVLDAWHTDWKNAWTLGSYFTPNDDFDNYNNNSATNLDRVSERAELDDNTAELLDGKKYNTNVIVNKGAVLEGYAYGGGLGNASEARTGDVYGNTYVAVLGGEVKKDVYGGGRAGGLDNIFEASGDVGFVASANAYVQGGTVRNVYGGGYQGHVGHHEGNITTTFTGDRLAKANVVIGKAGTNTFEGGAPAITRNIYGGGEGGSVYGTSHVTLNNGYVGYRYKGYVAVPNGTKLTEGGTYYTSDKGAGKFTATGEETASGSNYYKLTYDEELKDKTPGDLDLSGNVYGGGYVVNSYVDNAIIDMYGGQVRGCLYGGGEVGPIGRGANKTSLGKGGLENGDATIFRAGTTEVNMYDGKVLRNVFGGGRGKDSWGGDGTMYMDENVVKQLKADGLFCKGYIFGQTRVNIYGGEIGTEEGMAYGYGNVFGGCDEGTVYSAYMNNDKLYIGKKIGDRYDGEHEGYYFQYGPSDAPVYLTDGDRNIFTEDCKVVVEPHTRAYVDINISEGTGSSLGNGNYKAGEYVTTADLHRLKGKNEDNTWGSLDDYGIIIHNAVFAGGNIAAGSSSMYANATTVYGNATASIHDVYNRDLITIGTGHTGGLYGDGNLTFVDGYRELNITNYGTDYYHIASQLPYDDYKILPEREKAYYELKYKCLKECTDYEKTTYTVGSNLPYDELLALFTRPDGTSVQDGSNDIIVTEGGKKVPNPTYWQENGVVSVYAGRIMNTIQRADFCGVFGSRMVMKGAQDRVPEVADYTNYTINRVREVSLNKKVSIAGDPTTIEVKGETVANPNYTHGNYFGIYSNVNFLGALTSDVKFSDERTTNADLVNYPELEAKGETFYAWKQAHKDDKRRNNGICHNHLALASGVYLELTTEKGTGKGLYEKDWGPITGVIELDLINVSQGIGGGFVYARNEHGVPGTGKSNTTLTALNKGAASKWNYTYDTKYNNWEEAEGEDHKKEWQTSGNFIHSSHTIIDDCYNVGSKYNGKYGNKNHGGDSGGVPAHYWFISGSVYVYDQYISAYTGSPNAYSEAVEIPLTINAASHGTMTLMDVQPNLYAYYSAYTDASNNTPLTDGKKLVINDVTYQLNDPISYWDWYKLPVAERNLFVSDTYIVTEDCKIGSTDYTAGTVLLKSQYEDLISKDSHGDPIYPDVTHTKLVDGIEQDMAVPFTDVFRSSNNLSHTTGYLLTYNITNPSVWDEWYTPKSGSSLADKIKLDAYEKLTTAEKANYEDGPTYTPNTTGLYGQKRYDTQAIISQKEYHAYEGYNSNNDEDYTDADDVYGLKQMYPAVSSRTDQGTFVPAYVVTKEYTSSSDHYYPGAPVAAEISGYTEQAYISTATIQLSATEYIYVNDLISATQWETYYNRFKDGTAAQKAIAKDIKDLVVPAYICTGAGLYGGSYYQEGQNYRGLEAYSAMSETDRQNFTFNYDALDLLIDPDYSKDNNGNLIYPSGKKYQYDSATKDLTGAKANKATYSLATSIDYTATYKGTSAMTYKDANKVEHTVAVDQELFSTDYEALPNEQYHYAPITVDALGGTYYVVNESFVHGEKPYAVGSTIDSGTYTSLSDSEKENFITTFTFTEAQVEKDGSGKPLPFYYCREKYQVNEKGGYDDTPPVPTPVGATGGISQTTATIEGKSVTYDWVEAGTIIKYSDYSNLPNKQKNFTIHGVSPMETSTLFVSRDANINDLSTEKIITVIYKYDYEESDADGTHITPISERHVLNIHINFKSGVPTVEDINPPSTVLPGTSIYMRVPSVTPGAYEITGGGWEVFAKESDAESHINGVPYTPSEDPLYWYQDGFYLSYYAKTYLGKTYSNHVPVSVANYHDLKKVMNDKDYHLHVDYDRSRLKRDSKVYINDYSKDAEGSKNGLDLFKDFYDLSLISASGDGYTVDDGKITAATSPANTKLVDHTLLNTDATNGVKSGQNLEFFLRTDIDYPDNPETNDWTPIGTDDVCFKGTFHGDGHTIRGLDHSLFYNLCGDVYNLGVTGSFQTAGVVDKGIGYVESVWVKTSATTPLGTKPNAVFGNPTYTKDYQVVNSYFWNGNKNLYGNIEGDNPAVHDDEETITSGGARGKATAKSANAFYNGELAYDLNNFYLYKRYNDKMVTSGTERYSYFTIGDDDKLAIQNNHYYATHADLCSTGYVDDKSNVIMYVEDRYADGDFRYDGGDKGVIPDTEDERFYSWTVTDKDGNETVESSFFPIWPDDYIFFGQKLTYGYGAQTHQDVPTAVAREDGRLSYGDNANRVYRAPAYYRSKNMGVYHFNPTVYLAQEEKLSDAQIEANEAQVAAGHPEKVVLPREVHHPGMTAIDFAGHNGTNEINGTYGLGDQAGLFYPPLLDDDGLTSIQNCDETQNLLVYAPAETSTDGYANAKTHGVLTTYFKDPEYTTYYDNTDGYRLVREAPSGMVHGHLVQSDLKATDDHLLVDKQDFNCPIAYDFDGNHRMWYQRMPADEEFVDRNKGWQGVSIPFTAELVTTDDKGEITHFYSGSDKSQNGTTKGHEYWLREMTNESTLKQVGETKVLLADFHYPNAAGANKTVTNTFLWDYYYQNTDVHDQKDKNADIYLQYRQYYKGSRTYSNYPLLSAAKPYILGLPDKTYYEFDLSGKFEAENTAVSIPRLDKQTITFASDTHEHIGVSDDEMTGTIATYNSSTDYYFKPSYMNQELDTKINYVLNSEGNAYVQLNDDPDTYFYDAGYEYTKDKFDAEEKGTLFYDQTGRPATTWTDGTTYYKRTGVKTTKNDKNHVSPSVSAFRPYFYVPGAAHVKGMLPSSIVFSGTNGDEFEETPESALDGYLEIFSRGRNIVTRSHMKEPTTIRIVNAAGITLANFVLPAGETIETPVNMPGIYIVNRKKLSIR